ncbi:MAG TPA: DUF4433 domain-containing protein, partial [Candidatus Rothia avicola]|nr:DUF4433 domain-containing protein [Candidatus Rothia avicola]
MGIDWEEILDAEGEYLQSAYDSHVDDHWEEDTTDDTVEEITLTQYSSPIVPTPLNHHQQQPYTPLSYPLPLYYPQYAAPTPGQYATPTSGQYAAPTPGPISYKRPEIEFLHAIKECFYLYHFTHIDNLENILKHGLLPKREIEIKNIENISRDHIRADKLENCSSLSISHPNYKLIYTRKYNSDDNQIHDIVLQFATKKFDELDNKYYFFQSNAAKSIFPKHDLSIYEGVGAAQKL